MAFLAPIIGAVASGAGAAGGALASGAAAAGPAIAGAAEAAGGSLLGGAKAAGGALLGGGEGVAKAAGGLGDLAGGSAGGGLDKAFSGAAEALGKFKEFTTAPQRAMDSVSQQVGGELGSALGMSQPGMDAAAEVFTTMRNSSREPMQQPQPQQGAGLLPTTVQQRPNVRSRAYDSIVRSVF